MIKYYFDTSILRDYFENRNDKFRPLGEWAFNLLRKIVLENHQLIYTDLVISELKRDYSEDKVRELFTIIEKNAFKVEIAPTEAKEAAMICKQRKIPFGDALHAVVARDNQAVLITRDHHFELIQDIVQSYKPEDLI